jgi:glycosyltransferase involved in cell wall biosynthesis
VHIHPSPLTVLLQPFFILWKGRKLLAERPYALITSHDFGFFYNGIGAWLLTWRRNIPYVSEIHHIEGHPFALTRRELVYRWLARWYIRWSARRVAAFRVVNRSEVPDFLRDEDVPKEKILILPSMYIDFEIFHPQPDVSPQYDVLFVGRFVSNKGILTILEAVAQVRETHPEVRLALLGDGPLRDKIVTKIDEYHLHEHVTIIPRADTPADVARLYNQSKMVVCASTSEGGPRVTVEAMACGTPVISTPVGIMRDLMESGMNFLVFNWHAEPLAEAIRLLLDDDNMRRQLGENGEIAVQGFRADHVIEQYARGYHDLIRRLT